MSDSLWPRQAPLSLGFPRQEYCSGLPAFPSPGDLPRPRIEPVSPALAGGFFATESPGKPRFLVAHQIFMLLKQVSSETAALLGMYVPTSLDPSVAIWLVISNGIWTEVMCITSRAECWKMDVYSPLGLAVSRGLQSPRRWWGHQIKEACVLASP